MYNAWNVQLVELLQKFGMHNVKELVGRTDLLKHIDYSHETELNHNG
jgi:glutamate synthase domain-containing protein 2